MDEELDILGGRSPADLGIEVPPEAPADPVPEMGETSALDIYGSQSTLEPAGLGAATVFDLTLGMTIAFGVVFVFVMLLVWFAWRRDRPAGRWWVWAGGVILPLVAIVTLMAASTAALVATTRLASDGLVIEVTGYQFWWNVVYDPDGLSLRDANEIIIPQGRPVTFRLRSEDVIHSFWMPSISGKMDMIPGRVNTLTVTATEAGQFRGQCAEFCGLSHPMMAFEITVLPPEEFDAWFADAQGEARDVARPDLIAGRQVFLDSGCAACHEVRGVAEGGRVGPDLTRLGARASLGAGMWRMNQGTVAGWIADVQDMKPGAMMPSYNHLTGPDLRNLSAWLVSLR